MASIEFIYFHKSKYKFVQQATDEFAHRIQHYYKFKMTCLTPKINTKLPAKEVKKLEGEYLLNKWNRKSMLILLDENGKTYDSVDFARQLEHWLSIRSDISFVIGGAFGFDDAVYQAADTKISLSKMTFSHQIIKIAFVEQLYRACTIIRGESYHNP